MATAQTKRLWIIGAVLFAAVLIVASFAGREPAPEVTVAAAAKERLEATITSNGKVEPVAPNSLRAQLDTFVTKVHAVEGRSVRQGQLLLELDSAQPAAEVAKLRRELLAAQETLRAGRRGGSSVEIAQLESELRKAEADVTRLRSEHAALQRLAAKQAATSSEVDQAKLALDRAEDQLRFLQKKKEELTRQATLDVERGSLDINRVQTELRLAEERLRSTRVMAPVAGTLYSLPVRDGQLVKSGDLLAEVADLSRVRVRAFVDEPELGMLAENQNVEITWDAQPGRIWQGKTEVIPKAVVSRGTRSVGEVIVSVDNAKLELLPNTNVNVLIRVRESSSALVVPRGAVRTEPESRVVYVLEGDTIHRRPVKTGIASATKYEILDGLREGERVVVQSDALLRDNMTVRPATNSR